MRYRIEITPDAGRQLAGLPERVRRQIDARILRLAEDPRPPGVVFLKGQWRGLCRVRSGSYRIIYQVQDERVVVLIVRIGDRKDVYD